MFVWTLREVIPLALVAILSLIMAGFHVAAWFRRIARLWRDRG